MARGQKALWLLSLAALVGCAELDAEGEKDARVARDPTPAPDLAPADRGPEPDRGPNPDSALDLGPAVDGGPDATPDASPPSDLGVDAAPPPDQGAVPDGCVPAAEACNGVDDDCDGRTDEAADKLRLTQVCYGGPEGTGNVGACEAGLSTCTDAGEWGPCEGQVLPLDEACNAQDDDCDGVVDEAEGGAVLSEACYDGPDGTADVGACRLGLRACAAGAWGPCEGQVRPTQELCDGLDNDCDGAADNLAGGCACEPGAERGCYPGPAETEGVGPCVGGRQTCADDGRAWGPCVGAQGPEAERCDGTDEDCDGRVDEQVAGTGAPCAAGVGACRAEGQTVCDDARGEVVCAAMPGAPGAERCNDLDDDCDGRADEGLSRGAPCAVGVGACRASGGLVCDGAGEVVCSAQPGPPSVEACNNLDDDCDGQVDEGFDRGAPCEVGVGVCARMGQTVCRPEGDAVCSATPGPAGDAERCNGRDDDCDGQVDEGEPEAGVACATGQPGQCNAGTTACLDGRRICVPAAPPADETCDGVDEDCDGVTDEAPLGGPLRVTCYPAPAETNGVGPCRTGEQLCVNGGLGPCVGAVLPGPELCDGEDNDCNGRVDDVAEGSCVCQAGTERPCYPGAPGTEGVGLCRAGTQRCRADGTGYGACGGAVVPGPEQCDGQDHDCDGLTGDVEGVGEACAVGLGPCRVEGARRCVMGELACDAAPLPAGVETCNGEDADCDGVVDNVPGAGDACSLGVGACAREGRRVCADGPQPLCDAMPGAPADEICNGQDDDCDEATDEGLGGEACAVGVGACRREGVTACQGEFIGCGAQPGDPSPEVCNGLDDDCDGTADEAAAGQPCMAGVGACARAGVTTCVDAVGGCDAVPGAPGAEVCGGGDDDCDGQVDEGLDCAPSPSCEAARLAGADQSGVYRLQPPGQAEPVDVWCDMTTDGGGWTLVGSTLGTTLDDAGGAWYADLAGLAPAEGHQTVWDGLRGLGDRFDLRFACRDAVGAAADPFTVDLSFYDVGWYHEITTGADADSCFSENQGSGVDLPVPARRDNVGGVDRALGVPYSPQNPIYSNGDYLEGEDSCDSTSDFTVDLDDRGMDSEQSDGTDWGEDDGARKCGRTGLATGQWFLFARERRAPAYACPGDDPFEDDDTDDTALPVRVGPTWHRIICGGDEDWHTLQGVAGSCYQVTLRFRDAAGDIDVIAYDSAGIEIGRGGSVTDDEVAVVQAPEDGTIRFKVRGWLFGNNGSNEYTLTVDAVACP